MNFFHTTVALGPQTVIASVLHIRQREGENQANDDYRAIMVKGTFLPHSISLF